NLAHSIRKSQMVRGASADLQRRKWPISFALPLPPPGPGVLSRQQIRYSVTARSEEHTSELQSPCNLVCRLLLEKKKKNSTTSTQKIQHKIIFRLKRITPSLPKQHIIHSKVII